MSCISKASNKELAEALEAAAVPLPYLYLNLLIEEAVARLKTLPNKESNESQD